VRKKKKKAGQSMWDTLFKANLQRLRRSRMTQAELAKKSRIAKITISTYETGTRSPSWENAVAIARALGVSLDEFTRRFKPEAAGPGRPAEGG